MANRGQAANSKCAPKPGSGEIRKGAKPDKPQKKPGGQGPIPPGKVSRCYYTPGM
jgi:hypothetical protein